MPRKLGNVARSILVNAPLPTATTTYTVISHQFIINTIQQELTNNGFGVKHELYKCTKDAQEAIGKFIVDYNNDPDLSMMYAFVNSYNKMIKFGATFGVYVHESESFMVGNLGDWNRKHTGTADSETQEKIQEQMADAKDYYDQLANDKKAMTEKEITKDKFASMLGIFYMRGWMTIDMVSAAVREYNTPSYSYNLPNDNLWTCYNHILVALRQSNPRVWLANQSYIHLYMTVEFDLANFDEEETTDENVYQETGTTQNEDILLPQYIDPNQVDIEDAITAETLPFGDEDHIDGVDEMPEEKEEVTSIEDEFVTDEMEDEEMDKLLTPIDDTDKDSSTEDVKILRTDELTESKDVQFIPKDNVTAVQECSEEVTYVPVDEYPGVEVGDIVDIDSCYYEVFVLERMDGEEYFAIKPVSIDAPEIQGIPNGDAMSDTDDNEHQEVLDEAAEKGLPVFTGTEFNIDEVVSEEVDDTTHLPQAEEVVEEEKEDSQVRVAIAKEITELYGYNPEFTFIQKDDMYDVTLNTGETMMLHTDYVHSMMVNE
jgi:hypothetical protein